MLLGFDGFAGTCLTGLALGRADLAGADFAASLRRLGSRLDRGLRLGFCRLGLLGCGLDCLRGFCRNWAGAASLCGGNGLGLGWAGGLAAGAGFGAGPAFAAAAATGGWGFAAASGFSALPGAGFSPFIAGSFFFPAEAALVFFAFQFLFFLWFRFVSQLRRQRDLGQNQAQIESPRHRRRSAQDPRPPPDPPLTPPPLRSPAL